ncbi:hypothetical protein ACFRAO_06800 [Streptomyces sp. NPDC056656]|uniref:hypothetical protein n=1 Tax=Streptomyces sp. NPDC056656 TaxID=3345895 RepID=UPI0036932286
MGLALSLFAVGATPAAAQPQVTVTKSHQGNFAAGQTGTYTIKVTNSGTGPDSFTGPFQLTDDLPAGLTLDNVQTTLGPNCQPTTAGFACTGNSLPPGGSFTVTATVNVASTAPCSVTNTATFTASSNGISVSASDPTTITGCDSGGGGGSSILPINLSGIIPMFNNIAINHNIESPGATNSTNQNFGVNAP